MGRFALPLLLGLGLLGCALRHAAMDVPPPGGCDQCHRQSIGGNWEVSVAPVRLGELGGIPEGEDIVLREVQQIPHHREVPARRLAVFAAAAAPEAVGDQETGVQCFVCHTSPDYPPHRSLKGLFPHPWGQGAGGEP